MVNGYTGTSGEFAAVSPNQYLLISCCPWLTAKGRDLRLEINKRPMEQLGITFTATALQLLKHALAREHQVSLLPSGLQFLEGGQRRFVS